MAQLITLEEAAQRLGLSPEEMKKRLKTDSAFSKLAPIRDGSTLRFKVNAIDELARQLGLASAPDLPLASLDLDEPPGSDDFKVPALGKPNKPAKNDDDAPLNLALGDDDDVFSLAEEPKPQAPMSSAKLTPSKATKMPKGMSDSSSSSDSDVRLDGDKPKKKKDEGAVPTEEIALDFSGPGSAVIKGGSSAKLTAPKSSGKIEPSKSKAPPKQVDQSDSSEFELSLDADSDDFDLQLNPDGADEVDLGSLPKDKSGNSGSKRGGASGINLREPADSGISLEKKNKKAKDDSDASDADFELSLDSSAVASNTKLGAPKSGKLILDSDSSDSEFELTLDDSGGSLEQAALESDVLAEPGDKGDIFETDFEIPPMPDESASEAVALESDTDLEQSDFELAMDDSDVAAEDSGSEVVLLDDEDGSPAAKGKAKPKPLVGKGKGKKPAPVEDDVDVDLDSAEVDADDDDGSASKALAGAKTNKKGSAADDPEFQPTKPWGIVPVLFLAPALLFTVVGALMGFELLQTMWGYQQPRKPTAPIVRGLASTLDMELRDQ
jgi:hypothetical protein